MSQTLPRTLTPPVRRRPQAWADPGLAGVVLARRLRRHLAAEAVTAPVVVLGMAAHGVQVAAATAAELGADSGVLVTRPLRRSAQSRPALVAVAGAGTSVDLLHSGSVDADAAATAFEDGWLTSIADLVHEEAQWRAGSSAPHLGGRTVIITLDVLSDVDAPEVRAAVQAVRRHGPARVLVAAFAATPAAVSDVELDADAVVRTWTSPACPPCG